MAIADRLSNSHAEFNAKLETHPLTEWRRFTSDGK